MSSDNGFLNRSGDVALRTGFVVSMVDGGKCVNCAERHYVAT